MTERKIDPSLRVDETLAYDIGAFDGDTVYMLKALGYQKVVAFEPHPDAYGRMKSVWDKDTSVVCLQYAVSSESGKKVKMIVNREHPYLNSLESEWIETPRHKSVSNDMTECTVDTISLDDYIEKSGAIPSHIKIDAEGHELEILKGLHYKPRTISCEWVSEFLEKNLKTIEIFHNLGFTQFKICFREETPNESQEFLNYEQCIQKFKDLNEEDKNLTIWGNIWCS